MYQYHCVGWSCSIRRWCCGRLRVAVLGQTHPCRLAGRSLFAPDARTKPHAALAWPNTGTDPGKLTTISRPAISLHLRQLALLPFTPTLPHSLLHPLLWPSRPIHTHFSAAFSAAFFVAFFWFIYLLTPFIQPPRSLNQLLPTAPGSLFDHDLQETHLLTSKESSKPLRIPYSYLRIATSTSQMFPSSIST